MREIFENEFVTTTWSGGTTSQIFIEPENSSVQNKDFDFRISSATCDLDKSEFTPYNNFTRYITPLDGNLKLVNNGNIVNLLPFEIYCFDGENKVESYGKVRDYNLIIRKGLKGEMYSKKLDENELIFKVKSKRTIIFNYESYINYEYKKDKKEFKKFSSLELIENEEIILSGNGKILICEIN